jgi:hypothetical protein
MRGSGRSFSLKEAPRAQQVQAEIGRLLRQHYEASSSPISDQLAEVIKKIEQPDSQSVLAFRRGIPDEQAR